MSDLVIIGKEAKALGAVNGAAKMTYGISQKGPHHSMRAFVV